MQGNARCLEISNQKARALCIFITNEDPYDDNPRVIMEQVADGARKQGIAADQLHLVDDRKQAIQQEEPCLYDFLKNFSLEDAALQGQDATAWLAEHQEVVRRWTSCR